MTGRCPRAPSALKAVPRPRAKRPPESSLIDDAAAAVTARCRVSGFVTVSHMPIRDVSRATLAWLIHASR